MHTGVYAVGCPPTDPLARAAAAALACGPAAALSHATAAVLWGMRRDWTEPPEVTVTTHRVRPGIRIHRCTTLRRRDVTRQRGLWVTSPARTLLDIAPQLTPARLTRVYNDAVRSGYLHAAEVAELLDRCGNHPGATAIAMLAPARGGPTRSELEDAFQRFLDRYDLPRPQVNVLVGGYLADAYFPAQELIVEIDGFDFHSDRASFERDRERDAAALEGGRRTLRLTHERLTGTPEREAARMRRILSA